ncbi:MAG: signal transduction histidine kinase [Bacillota bacterium]|nr:signal transduction histidine kinase [Bacillota bacterium]
MKTIKTKISSPFLKIIFAIPLMILILFNLSMHVYVDRTSREELKSAASGIEILIRQQLMDNALNQTADPMSSEGLTGLRNNLKLSKASLLNHVKSMNIEFLLIAKDGTVLFPKSYNDSFLSQRIVAKATANLDHAEENTIIKYRVGREKYYATYQMLTDGPTSTRLAFISSGSQAAAFARLVNMILFVITALSAALATSIALKVSKELSLPISRLTDYAKRIGSGEFLELPEDLSSVEIYELTKSMNEMSQQLKQYDNAQKSFLQNASHELRTPLMSIQGYAEGISAGVFLDAKKTAEIIREESRRLNHLVEQLLTLSRIENKNYHGELSCSNLCDNMKEYLQRINGYAMKEGKLIKQHFPKESYAAMIDDTLLAQAVINTLSNCVKHARGTVTAALFAEGCNAVIQISDDGDGISAEDLPHIFERFYKGKGGNFGLGLSIAKSAVEFMGGSITAYNSNGAVFEIRIPLS